MNLDFTAAKFLKSAAKFSQYPEDIGGEVAFVGRSNAGKSSAINAITNQTKLARKSKTPGRTRLYNFFNLTDNARLVDLPGYGFAKISEKIRRTWQDDLYYYLNNRESLRGLVAVMDSRHPLTEQDWQLLEHCIHQKIPTLVLLTKADKLSRNQANQTLFKVNKELKANGDLLFAQLFSALKNQGIDEARLQLTHWLI